MQTALLTRSEIEWLLGKREFSKSYERKMRAVLNKKLQTWERLERPLLEARGFLAATISSSDATTCSSGLGRYAGDTVRSSIADTRVASDETKPKPNELETYEKEEEQGCSGRDLNPGSATRKAAMLDRTVQLDREIYSYYTTGAFANCVKTFP